MAEAAGTPSISLTVHKLLFCLWPALLGCKASPCALFDFLHEARVAEGAPYGFRFQQPAECLPRNGLPSTGGCRDKLYLAVYARAQFAFKTEAV